MAEQRKKFVFQDGEKSTANDPASGKTSVKWSQICTHSYTAGLNGRSADG